MAELPGLIQLQFSRQYDVTSGLIAWFTQGKYSHVDALLKDGTLTGARSDVVGNIPAGVRNRPAGYAHWKYVTVVALPVTLAQEKSFYDFNASQIGKPYDTSDIWSIATGARDRDWRADDSWICSELQTVALEIANVFQEPRVSASKVAPDPLYLACSVVGFRDLP
jgi:uncharacterized protein YycO